MNFVLGYWLMVYLLALGLCGQASTSTDTRGECRHSRTDEVITQVRDASGKLWDVEERSYLLYPSAETHGGLRHSVGNKSGHGRNAPYGRVCGRDRRGNTFGNSASGVGLSPRKRETGRHSSRTSGQGTEIGGVQVAMTMTIPQKKTEALGQYPRPFDAPSLYGVVKLPINPTNLREDENDHPTDSHGGTGNRVDR